MFFADPAAAFANIARALRPGGRMIFAAWGPVAVNPYWRLPMAVASERLGTPPASPPHAPGPMGLAEVSFVEDQLAKAGLSDFAVTPRQITLGVSGGAADLAAQNLKIGVAARLMRMFDGTEADRRAIEEALTAAYADYEDGEEFAMPATLNIIEAQVS